MPAGIRFSHEFFIHDFKPNDFGLIQMLYLGIDIGTTKVSAIITSPDLSVHYASSQDHNACLPLGEGLFEHDFALVEDAVKRALAGLPSDKLSSICGIGLTCHMHSVIRGRDNGEVSTCVTWQDRRAESELEEMRNASGCNLFPGYGAVTLAYYAKRGELESWDWAGTPADELARRLTGKKLIETIEPSLAAPWGIYDSSSCDWNYSAAEKLGIPRRFLPRIVPAGTVIGLTAEGFDGIKPGIPVYAAIGDNQASVIGSGGDLANDLFVTVGTGSQLSAIVDAATAAKIKPVPGLDFRPFPGGSVLVAVPPLSGGKTWSLMGEAIASILRSFGAEPPPEKKLLDIISDFAEQADPDAGGIRINADFFGSRVHCGQFGSISGITASNFTLPNIAKALADGIVRNLFEPMPEEIIKSKTRMTGSGNGLAKCTALRNAVQAACSLPLVMPCRREETATGAALCAHMFQ